MGSGAGPQEEDLRENTVLDWKDREKHSSSREGRGCLQEQHDEERKKKNPVPCESTKETQEFP